MNTNRPILAVTLGDVNGVGPEIVAKAFARADLYAVATPIVIGCAEAYAHASAHIPNALDPIVVDDPANATRDQGRLPFLTGVASAPDRTPGRLNPEAGRAAMRWLERAVDLARDGKVDGIVTCPIHKEGIHLAGYTCRGHTDFIAERLNTGGYWMCLYARELLVVHVTDHESLRTALDGIRRERIEAAIRIADETLARLGRPQRRIAVPGLNPHAGEAGAFGSEETTEIAPAIATCRGEGIDVTGPHSPDAVFRHALDGAFDAVIALYHDQGHIPMKLVAMDDGVNVTLGIPIVRTSVDHGTAFDIAGSGTARENSFVAAYTLAARMATSSGCVTQP